MDRWACRFARVDIQRSLVGGHLSPLGRTIHSFESLQSLPSDPAEFVFVPHAHKRPACARVLQIRVVQIVAINGTVVPNISWNMKIANLLAVLVADDIAQTTVVHCLRAVFRVPNDLVNEVAQIPRGDIFGEDISAFVPRDIGSSCERLSPSRGCAWSESRLKESPSGSRRHCAHRPTRGRRVRLLRYTSECWTLSHPKWPTILLRFI